MILLIDGYNLLFSERGQSDDTKPNHLETLRENLVAQLKSYDLKRKHRIIVVFDGDKTNTHYPQEKESDNVRVVFSQGRATADEHIINLASSYVQDKSRRSDVSVVTSDRALAETLIGHKVKVVSSEEFAAELTKQNVVGSPDLKGEPMEKFTGLKPADVPKWLKLFGTTDDTDSADD